MGLFVPKGLFVSIEILISESSSKEISWSVRLKSEIKGLKSFSSTIPSLSSSSSLIFGSQSRSLTKSSLMSGTEFIRLPSIQLNSVSIT